MLNKETMEMKLHTALTMNNPGVKDVSHVNVSFIRDGVFEDWIILLTLHVLKKNFATEE